MNRKSLFTKPHPALLLLMMLIALGGYAQNHICFVVDSVGYCNDTFRGFNTAAVDLQFKTPVDELIFPDSVVGPTLHGYVEGHNYKWRVVSVMPYHATGALADNATVTLPQFCERVTNFKDTKVGTINFNANLKTIGDMAFARCTMLKSLYIPASVSNINTSAFYECSGIEKVEWEAGSQLTRISQLAFGNTSISEVTLPDNCKTIDGWAFQVTPMRKVVLPRNFETIYGNAFLSTADTLHVYVQNCLASTKTVYGGSSTSSFSARKKVIIHIPVGTLRAFQQVPTWASYQLEEDEAMGCEHLIDVTVQRPDSGTVDIVGATQLRPGLWTTSDRNDITIKCKPIAGNEVFYCTVDGVDVTDQFNSDWELTIPAVDHDIEVYIGFARVKTYVPLVLKQDVDNNVTVLVYNKEPLKLNFKPDPGWWIHSITINGKDITKKLDGYGDVTIRKVNGEIIVGSHGLNATNIGQEEDDDNTPFTAYIAFEKQNDAINSVLDDQGMKVYGHKGGLRIMQASEGSSINIYDTAGHLLISTVSDGSALDFDLPSGIYIITGDGKTVKIAI